MFGRNSKLRIILMAILFLVGLGLIIYGWTLTGKMTGLGIMIVGTILLVTALMLYNHPYKKEKKNNKKEKKQRKQADKK